MKKGHLILLVLINIFHLTGIAQSYRMDSLRSALTKTDLGVKRVDILNALAFEYLSTAIYQAEDYTNEALRSAHSLNYAEGSATALKNLGLVNFVKGEYSLATEYSYKALKMYTTLQNKKGEARVLNNLAMIMMALDEYDRAYHFANQSIKLKRNLGDSLGVYNTYLVLADYYRCQDQFEEARRLASETLQQFEKLNNKTGRGYALFTLGNIAMSEKLYTKATAYYKSTIVETRNLKNYNLLIDANKELGKLYLESENLDSAYILLHNTLNLAKANTYQNIELETLQYLAHYFSKKDQLDSALYYTKAAAKLERDIFDRQKRDQIATLQMLYNIETKDQELEFQKTVVRRQYIAITGVTLILILSVIFGFRISALNKSNKEAKEKLIESNAEKNRINENLEAIVYERTEELKKQNHKILEYAFFTAHEVRGPLARILGLIELAKIKELNEDDKKQIMIRLEDASTELDETIRSINRKLENTKI